MLPFEQIRKLLVLGGVFVGLVVAHLDVAQLVLQIRGAHVL